MKLSSVEVEKKRDARETIRNNALSRINRANLILTPIQNVSFFHYDCTKVYNCAIYTDFIILTLDWACAFEVVYYFKILSAHS